MMEHLNTMLTILKISWSTPFTVLLWLILIGGIVGAHVHDRKNKR